LLLRVDKASIVTVDRSRSRPKQDRLFDGCLTTEEVIIMFEGADRRDLNRLMGWKDTPSPEEHGDEGNKTSPVPAPPPEEGLLSEAERKAASPALWGGIWGGGADS
jgi:hypothetical protein